MGQPGRQGWQGPDDARSPIIRDGVTIYERDLAEQNFRRREHAEMV